VVPHSHFRRVTSEGPLEACLLERGVRGRFCDLASRFFPVELASLVASQAESMDGEAN